MRRLREENINTPAYFDYVWNQPEMHRYDAVRLREFLKGMDESKRLLDVGAGLFGAAQYAVHHGWKGQYVAIDYSLEARRLTLQIAPALDYRIADVLHMPFDDGSFDVVACGELIEHMDQPSELVAELARVCRVGGRVVLSTVDVNCENAKKLDYPEHVVAWDSHEELRPLFEPYGKVRTWVLGDYLMAEVIKK